MKRSKRPRKWENRRNSGDGVSVKKGDGGRRRQKEVEERKKTRKNRQERKIEKKIR